MSTVLVVGSGGREHALGWKLSASPKVTRIIAVPGNDGFPAHWERWKIPISGPENLRLMAQKAHAAHVDLAVIGPDNPLAEGIVDVFQREGVTTFGPTAKASLIEASKRFSKEVMTEAKVPTAKYFVANKITEARKILKSVPWSKGWVIKADGLALGKGVRVCDTFDGAVSASSELLPISGKVVIEEKVSGKESSWMAFCDGERCSLLEPARDFKRLLDGDKGPNTGGMGAYSPLTEFNDSFFARVREEVFLPTLGELKKRGSPYRGLLYAGLMVDERTDKFWVLEFNSRFGDPETQALLPRMEDDLFEWCMASAKGDLSKMPGRVPFSRQHAVVVVACAKGYPGAPDKGQVISGLDEVMIDANRENRDAMPSYFLAGVARRGEELVTNGGRVLCALGTGGDLTRARSRAYERLNNIQFSGMHYRSDIASG